MHRYIILLIIIIIYTVIIYSVKLMCNRYILFTVNARALTRVKLPRRGFRQQNRTVQGYHRKVIYYYYQ